MARGRKRNQKRKPIDAQKETTTNDESAGSGTDGTEQPFDWTTERVLALLNCMIRRKPAGMHKHANMILIKTHLSERLKMDVPIKEIWKFLHAHWDMDEADKIEFQVTNIEKKDFELPQTEEWTQLVEEQGAIIREAENKNKDSINQASQAATSNVDLKTLKSVKVMVEKIDSHSMFINRFKSNK